MPWKLENSFRGNAGQANYVAGCLFQDVYSTYLNQMHRFPCKIINWGLWGDTGMASAEKTKSTLISQGLMPMTNHEGLQAFVTLIELGDYPQAAYIKAQPVLYDALHMEHVTTHLVEALEASQPKLNNDQLLTLPYSERMELLINELSARLGAQLQLSQEQIITDAPLSTLGMDSLMGITFRNVISAWISQPLPVTLVFDYPTLNALANYIASDVLHWERPDDSLNELCESADEIEQLDEDELINLLFKKTE